MNIIKSNTVFVSGYFNILHPGHLRLFRAAKEYGSRLVVAIISDRLAGESAHLSQNLRLEGVQSNGLVDDAFILDIPVADAISKIRPEIVVKGKEHESRFNSELEALQNYGGRLVFSSGETIFSSLDLIQREFRSIGHKSIILPNDYLKRHSIEKSRLVSILKSFENLKVCVVGDLIIDEYISCEPLGMSQEDPTIVVMPVDSKRFIGGAGIVASHAAGLGATVKFISVTGKDASRDYALERLASEGVEAVLLVDDSRPTTLKQRYRSKGKSLLRVSHLHQSAISATLQAEFLLEMEQTLKEADLLVFSDFNYGCLPQQMVDQIVVMAKMTGVTIAADSQSSSQVGDIGRFKGMDLITPTEREARISTRNREDGLVVLAEQLREQSAALNILLKLGEEGLLIHTSNGRFGDWLTDRVEALNSNAKDVSGAGDSLLIASAMTLACDGTIWEAACMGSLASALQVSRVGNIPLKTDELMTELMK